MCRPGTGSGDYASLNPIHMGQDPVPRDHISALYLQFVLAPPKFPASELRVLPWLTGGPFPSLHLVAFVWGQAALSGFLLCDLLSENLWWCHVNLTAYHRSNHRGHDCLVSPRLSSGNSICNSIVILIWVELISNVLFVLGIYELPSVIHRHISILLLVFASYGILTFFFSRVACSIYSIGPFSLST